MTETIYIIKLVWRFLWMIILVGILAGIAVYTFMSRQENTYTATTIFTVAINEQLTDSSEREQAVDAYVQLLTTRPILEIVIAKRDLALSADQLRERIEISQGALITVQVSDTDPVQAAVIANTLMQTLVEEGRTILGVDRTMRRASIQIIEQAQPNSVLSSGGPMRIVALAVVTSALVTIGIIWAVDYADTSVRSAKHIERAFGIQTLSTIPCASFIDTHTNLVSTTKPSSVVTEAYRLLRVRIATAAHEQTTESILVASSEHDVGRSTIAANLAVVLAQSGKRVVIVDTDLRRPTIHRLFGLNNQRGVTDILYQATPSSVEEFLQPTHVKNLYALTSGTRTNYPTELLETDTIQRLLDQLKAYADIIVLDSPPLRHAVDAIVVARCIDTTVLVAQVGKTSQEYLEDAISQLHSFNVNLLGVVLNNRPNVLIQLPAFVILKKNIDAKARNQHDLTQKNDVQREPVAHSADMT